MKAKGLFPILIICFLAHGLVLPASADDKNPKLVLQITVDQLRGDLPMRFKERLGKGGFRYLLEKGTHYNNANYQHANTETAVGHATLATGAEPPGSLHSVLGCCTVLGLPVRLLKLDSLSQIYRLHSSFLMLALRLDS